MIFGIFGVYGAINQVVATRLANINKDAHKKEADLDSAEIYKRHHHRLMLNVFAILASLFGAAGMFALIEDWTFARGLYFAVQTATVSACMDSAVCVINVDFYLCQYRPLLCVLSLSVLGRIGVDQTLLLNVICTFCLHNVHLYIPMHFHFHRPLASATAPSRKKSPRG